MKTSRFWCVAVVGAGERRTFQGRRSVEGINIKAADVWTLPRPLRLGPAPKTWPTPLTWRPGVWVGSGSVLGGPTKCTFHGLVYLFKGCPSCLHGNREAQQLLSLILVLLLLFFWFNHRSKGWKSPAHREEASIWYYMILYYTIWYDVIFLPWWRAQQADGCEFLVIWKLLLLLMLFMLEIFRPLVL